MLVSRSMNRSSLLLILSGILTAGSTLFHPDTPPAGAIASSWVVVHLLLGLAAVMAVFGIAGLYAPMRIRMSFFGQTAFVLAVIGSILFSGLMFFVEGTMVPVIADNPALRPLLEPGGLIMTGSLGFMIGLSLMIMALGWVLLAAYLIGTNTISAINGSLVVIGIPLLAFTPPLPLWIGILGGVFFGAGLAWLGFSIRTGLAREALKETIRLEDECFIQAGGHA